MYSNKIITSALLTLTAAAVLTSCDFEENCPSRGYLKAYVKNDTPEISPRGWQDRNLLYFPYPDVKEPAYFSAADVFKSDTLIRETPSGTYDLVLLNKGTNILRETADNRLESLVLECPKDNRNGKVFLPVEQVYITSSVKKGVVIRQWETTEAAFVMKPLVKRINLRINVLDDEVGKPVVSFKAYLSGVASSKNPATMKIGSDYATQIFSGNEKKGKVFLKGLWIFGVNGAVSNELTLVGSDDDGHEYTVTTDITDQLKHLNDDSTEGIDISISVYFKPQLNIPSMEIDGWKDIPYPPSVLEPNSVR